MRDDRVHDGQVMQLDQCLSCTRYEPIFGQTYDLLNEIGSNTAMILDDTSMAYMNLRDYSKFTRIEEAPEPMTKSVFDTTMNSVRPATAIKFKDEWDQGVKMKWKLTPKENQKPICNWRQDINKPDKSPKKLPSFQFNMANAGSQTGGASVASDACPILAGNKKEVMAIHYEYMENDGHKIEEVAKFFDMAKDYVMEKGGHGRASLTAINTQKYADTLNKICEEKKVDPMLILSIFAAESDATQGKAGGGIAQLSALKDKNGLTAEEDIGTAVDAIKSYLDKYSAGDNVMLPVTLFGAGAAKAKHLQKKNKDTQLFDKDWVGAMKYDLENTDEIFSYWPKVVNFYRFFSNSDTKKSVLAQGDANSEYDFLFKDNDLGEVNFVSDYGGKNESSGNSSMSQSITFNIKEENKISVISSREGHIMESGKDELGNFIKVRYGDNEEIEYHGLSSLSDKKEIASPKTELGKAGKVVTVIYYVGGKPEDPKLIWPSLRGKESKDTKNGTLGAIVLQGQSTTQDVTSKDSVVVGGGTDGTYDMDDISNYDMSAMDKNEENKDKKDKSSNDGKADDKTSDAKKEDTSVSKKEDSAESSDKKDNDTDKKGEEKSS